MSESSVEEVLHGARELQIEEVSVGEPKRDEPHRTAGSGRMVWIVVALMIAVVIAIALLR